MNGSNGDIPIVVLAGGQGRRLAMGDKAQVMLAEKPLLDHVIGRLPLPPELIAINGPKAHTNAAHPHLIDSEFSGDGPLSGVLTALKWAQSLGVPAVLTVSVDTPFLPLDLYGRLSENIDQICYASEDKDPQARGNAHPTCALWPISCAMDLSAFLSSGDRKLMRFIEQYHGRACRFPATDPSSFFNINTAEDLQTAERYLQGKT